jgi:hypothetical protein
MLGWSSSHLVYGHLFFHDTYKILILISKLLRLSPESLHSPVALYATLSGALGICQVEFTLRLSASTYTISRSLFKVTLASAHIQ